MLTTLIRLCKLLLRRRILLKRCINSHLRKLLSNTIYSQLKAPNSLSNIVEIAEALSTATPTEHTHLKTPFSGLEEGRHVVTLV